MSRTLSAIADPTRRAILRRLMEEGDASVGELARPFDLGQRAISKHVSVLERAGLVSRERRAQRRLSRLRFEPLEELDEWIGTYRRLWEERRDNIADVMARVQDGTEP